MPFSPQPKVPGDLILSADWNEAMTEIVRLDQDKLNTAGGNVSNALSVGAAITTGTNPALRLLHNGSYNWGNALSIDQTAVGFNDGPKIRFQKTMPIPKSWSAGIINGANAGQFVVSEDTNGSFGTARLTIAPGGNVGIGINDPQSKLHVTGNVSTPWAFAMEHYEPAWGDNAKRVFLSKGWNGTIGDFLSISATGNRDNNAQGSIIMSSNFIQFGKGHNNGGQLTTEYMSVDGSGLSVKTGAVNTPRLSFGDSTELFRGALGPLIIFPGGGTPTNYLNVSMGRDSGTPPYVFRVGHVRPGTPGGGFGLALDSFVNKLTVNQDGLVRAAGAFSPNGADYAEYFESENGKSIPIGTAVAIGNNGMVRPVKKGETPIGIVTQSPGVLGNNPMEWPKQFLRDEYGNVLMESFEEDLPVSEEAAAEWQALNAEGKNPAAKDRKRLLKTVRGTRPRLNPEFDPQRPYVSRDQRPEWQIIGLLGQLHLTKGQPTATGWVKLRDVSDNVELWLVK